MFLNSSQCPVDGAFEGKSNSLRWYKFQRTELPLDLQTPLAPNLRPGAMMGKANFSDESRRDAVAQITEWVFLDARFCSTATKHREKGRRKASPLVFAGRFDRPTASITGVSERQAHTVA